ncbi:carboxypeptidase PM20D1 [Methylacidimicrobium cyclopophantes]|uniref:Carboxypeptidase PM20D1 n=1 Tax=Methylacidimicrobium cyclopophantes TaxID=1041766 RepID=A0A5E6MFV7_9BACT|nr:carboxypeptidase PM20D1 [Methylacidimicrobium cyclopophantes]
MLIEDPHLGVERAGQMGHRGAVAHGQMYLERRHRECSLSRVVASFPLPWVDRQRSVTRSELLRRSLFFFDSVTSMGQKQATMSATPPPPLDWDSLQKEALEILRGYIQIPSVNPPADTTQTAAFLQKILEAKGLSPQLYSSGPVNRNLLARLPGRDPSRKPLLLLNHMDVVPVDAARWKTPPFAATVADGFVWGRGTFDMKGLGIQQLMALLALKRAGIVPPRTILFLATADEESGGHHGARWMIEHHWEELDPEYVLDEGGFGTRDLFLSPKLVFTVQVGDKQPFWLRLRTTGRPGHGSIPTKKDAPAVLLRALLRILERKEVDQPPAVVEAMISRVGAPLAPHPFTESIQRNSIALTSLLAGVGTPPKINVIPSVAEATLDCRLLPGVDPDEFLSSIRALVADLPVTIELANDLVAPTPPSPWDTPLFGAIERTIAAHYPDAVVSPLLSTGFTDARHFRQKGAVAYGFQPVILDHETAWSAHSDSERIPVAEFQRGIRLLFDLLQEEF